MMLSRVFDRGVDVGQRVHITGSLVRRFGLLCRFVFHAVDAMARALVHSHTIETEPVQTRSYLAVFTLTPSGLAEQHNTINGLDFPPFALYTSVVMARPSFAGNVTAVGGPAIRSPDK